MRCDPPGLTHLLSNVAVDGKSPGGMVWGVDEAAVVGDVFAPAAATEVVVAPPEILPLDPACTVLSVAPAGLGVPVLAPAVASLDREVVVSPAADLILAGADDPHAVPVTTITNATQAAAAVPLIGTSRDRR